MAIDATVQAIYDKAIYLIDAQNDSTGATVTGDTTEYRARTIGILNTLIDEVYPASDTFAIGEDGKRPALDDITAFTDELDLDARILRDVLPYGLAARLLTEEDPMRSNFFEQIYEQNLALARNSAPANFESIGTDDEDLPYGGIEWGQFAYWPF